MKSIKRFVDKDGCKYDLENIPLNTICINPTREEIDRQRPHVDAGECTLWGAPKIPCIGDRVKINFNALGEGSVESYFTECGWLGVCIILDVVPAWKKRQQRREPRRMECALVFGAEITLLDESTRREAVKS